jgi:hypothetical protein
MSQCCNVVTSVPLSLYKISLSKVVQIFSTALTLEIPKIATEARPNRVAIFLVMFFILLINVPTNNSLPTELSK